MNISPKRMREDDEEPLLELKQPNHHHRGRKLKQYVVEEKLDIIDFAKVNGNRAAGREFSVAESSIREWRKNEERLRCMLETAPERSRLDGGGRRLVSDQLEKLLVDYVNSLRDRNETINFAKVRSEAMEIWRRLRVEENNNRDKEFNASMGWVCRFMKRNDFRFHNRDSPENNNWLVGDEKTSTVPRKRRRKAEMPIKLETGGFVVRQDEVVRVSRVHDEDENVDVC